MNFNGGRKDSRSHDELINRRLRWDTSDIDTARVKKSNPLSHIAAAVKKFNDSLLSPVASPIGYK